MKKTLANAKGQVEDAAQAVKDALPSTKGVSGEPSRKMGDPVFLEEPGEMATAPPIANKRRYGDQRRENMIVTLFSFSLLAKHVRAYLIRPLSKLESVPVLLSSHIKQQR